MARKVKKPSKNIALRDEDIELKPDAWEQFERGIQMVGNARPKPPSPKK